MGNGKVPGIGLGEQKNEGVGFLYQDLYLQKPSVEDCLVSYYLDIS